MNRILRGIKDVQNLSNSLCVQNEILQESHAELADHVNTQQESEPASTPNTNEATSSSTAAEAPGRNEIDARKILKEKKAWRERNKHLVEDLRKRKNRVGSEETEGESTVSLPNLENWSLGS
ncbi:hypothetical protein Pyn_20715 [Prunus yedoensis var. nudiflora]|uniref:Uncharacterized protein n=1 Tax=Prunus yedoensis var. nudiflora TaxID=2094558 RepID=A0A314YFS5_PRUYE|nr:hypothetical protein Pyn_20715 [Prunus yedoensis var. nudiflora]